MLCYIKDFKSFKTIAKYDAVSYALPDGEEGTVTIYQKNPIELTQKYLGMWLLINDGLIHSDSTSAAISQGTSGGYEIAITSNDLLTRETLLSGGGMSFEFFSKKPKPRQHIYYISGCTPNYDSIELRIVHPIEAFEREVVYGGENTYGQLIYNILVNDYGTNCPDSEYAITCLNVTNTDATECIIEPDQYGYIIPKDCFKEARKNGVAINFSLSTTNTINVDISTADYPTGIVVMGDGHNQLSSESYDASFCAKVTVIYDNGNISEIEWTNGDIDSQGTIVSSTTRLCSSTIALPEKSTIIIEPSEGYKAALCRYTSEDTFVECSAYSEDEQRYYYADASKNRILVGRTDNADISTDESSNLSTSYFYTIDYYLSAYGDISTTIPQERAKGTWRVVTSNSNEEPEDAAYNIFKENLDNHKIEFYSDKYFEYYQPLSIRLRGEIVQTTVTSRVHRNTDNRYFYVCGNLATTLTDKVRLLEE